MYTFRIPTIKLLRMFLGFNSTLWLIKLARFIEHPETAMSVVLNWFVHIDYLYLFMLGLHVVCVIANVITKDARAWVGELEIVVGVLISSTVLTVALHSRATTPEQVTCLLIAALVFFGHHKSKA